MRIINLTLIGWLIVTGPARGDHHGHGTASGPAETQPTTATAPAEDKGDKAAGAVLDKKSVTRHEIRIGGEQVAYQATAADMLLKDEEDKLKARVFFIAYEREPADGAKRADRPLTFVFNGGPGAAAVWLHLGTAGPRRIVLGPEGTAPPPPYRLTDNGASWLDATDLVFIDPVGTGFSRPAEGEKGETFYGVREDIRWVGEFIRVYLTTNGRWLSPLYLAGESYGTTRAAGLSQHLLDAEGIALNGVILISTVLDFQTLSPEASNDLPYVLYLPTYAACAYYHKMLAGDRQFDFDRTLREARAFAATEYSAALLAGAALPPDRREQMIRRLGEFTGLPSDLIDKADLRIAPSLFQKHLLAKQHRILGRFDGRITGLDPEPLSNRPAFDPSLSEYLAIYTSTFNQYVRDELGYESLLTYEVLSDKVRPWKFGDAGAAGHGYLSVMDNLQQAMVRNPHMRVLFASGYYDMATPFFATEHTVDHLNLPTELRANIERTFYQGGHMMYHHPPALEQLKADVAGFINHDMPAR